MTPLASRTAVWSVVVMFAINGLVLGAFAGSLPAMRERLDLPVQGIQIPLLLIVSGICAITTMQLGGRLADRLGARRVALSALPLLTVGVLIYGFAPSYPVAIAGNAFLGLGNGAMDVAMNAYGVQVEQARRRPIMSFFHAMWSAGNFAGAALILLLANGLGAHGHRVIAPLMVSAAVLTVVSLVFLLKAAPPSRPIHHTDESGVRTKVPIQAWVLGFAAICFGLAEGTGNDWSALHATTVTGVDATTGAVGFAVFTLFMVAIRLLGDRAVARFGRRNVVRFGGGCAALGFATVATLQPLPAVLAGWALVGFGVGMIAPQVYAVAGHMGGGRVLALVVTFGYATFLVGPAFTGFVIHRVGIQHAMFVPAVLCASLLFLAVVMPREDTDLAH